MKETMKTRYAPLGGIEKVLASYKRGDFSLAEIGERIGISKTSVCNDFRYVFGAEGVEEAQKERKQAASKKSAITALKNGKPAKMSYSETVACLKSGEIERKGFLSIFETVVQLARSVTGIPDVIRFGLNSIREIEGKEGIVKIRYGEPKKKLAEYRIDRYRFKITPGMAKNVDALIFCLKGKGKFLYYVFPPEKVAKIKSLNLKFDKQEKSKYAAFLAKVEPQK